MMVTSRCPYSFLLAYGLLVTCLGHLAPKGV
jgi:hypothetical protein